MRELNEIQCEKASRTACPIVNTLKAKVRELERDIACRANEQDEADEIAAEEYNDMQQQIERHRTYLEVAEAKLKAAEEENTFLLNKIGLDKRPRIVQDGEPCSHRECASHKTHPCEGCGRTNAFGDSRDWPVIEHHDKKAGRVGRWEMKAKLKKAEEENKLLKSHVHNINALLKTCTGESYKYVPQLKIMKEAASDE